MFENLKVYQKSVDLAENIINLTEYFPRRFYFLSDQLNRASLSVSTNIAEGNGRITIKDRCHFFVMARGSLQECVPLLEIARRKELVSEQKKVSLRAQLEMIAKMLSGLINGLKRSGEK